MLHKKDIVASNLYHTEIVKVYGLFQFSLLSTEFCFGFAMKNKTKTELIDRIKSQLQIKIIWIQIKVNFKSKISNRLKSYSVKKYSECFINVLKLRLSFSLGKF